MAGQAQEMQSCADRDHGGKNTTGAAAKMALTLLPDKPVPISAAEMGNCRAATARQSAATRLRDW